MKSKTQIRETFEEIATDFDVAGESKEFLIELLTYAVHQSGTDSLNAAYESSFSLSTNINSKLQQAADRMYSAYRGKSPQLNLEVTPEAITNRSKFDEVFSANSFKLFSKRSIITSPGASNVILETLLSTRKIEFSTSITSTSKFFVEVEDPNIAEELLINLNGIEVAYTRIFSDHLKFHTTETPMLFVVTIPDYGIRVFNKEAFQVSDVVEVIAFEYVKLEDINPTELSKIKVDEGKLVNSVIIDEVPRENPELLIYKANESLRMDSIMKSNVDISNLFTEVFKDKVFSSITEFNEVTDEINIIYIPINEGVLITTGEFDNFLEVYGSYYVSPDINLILATKKFLSIELDIVAGVNEDIYNSIKSLFSTLDRILNVEVIEEQLNAQVNRIDGVSYVKEMVILEKDDVDDLTGTVYSPLIDKYVVSVINVNSLRS